MNDKVDKSIDSHLGLPSKTSFLFHSIIKNSKIASIFIMDENGIILEINPGVERFFGYTIDDLYGKNFSILFIQEDIKAGVPLKELNNVIHMGSSSDNNYVVHKNGKHIWVTGESILGKDLSDRIFIIKIIYDLSIQHELEKNLISVNNELNNFVYAASHDLKAPINNIEGLIGTLEDSLRNGEDLDKIISLMKESVYNFKTVLGELAETGKGIAKDGKGEITLIQFKNMVEEIILHLKDSIVRTNAEVKYDFNLAPEISFSKKNLRSIIHNLLSNAIKFSSADRKPQIFMKTEKADGYIIFKIRDNGIGIRDSDKGQLFTIYHRLHEEIEGSGVGLAIVKRIIDNVGGKIEVESKEGVGTTFSVYLKIN